MRPLDCHLPAKKACFEARNKGFVGGQKFVSAPETNVSVRKRFVFPKLTNLRWHPYCAAGNGVSSSGAIEWCGCQCISATGAVAGVGADVVLVAGEPRLKPRKSPRQLPEADKYERFRKFTIERKKPLLIMTTVATFHPAIQLSI